MKFFNRLIFVVLTAVLAACGGGGGSSGSTTTGGSSSGGSGTTEAKSSASLVINNESGSAVTSISVGGAFLARVTIRDASGAPVAGKLVTFSLGDTSLATLEPSTAVTNASGVAEVAIAPASLTSKGAASLAVTSTDSSGETVQALYDFSVSAANLTLSAITVGSSSLTSGGNTSARVTAMVGGAPSTGVPVNVVYTASCGRINGQDAIAGVSVSTDGAGVASVTYLAVASDGSLCSGAVTVTAKSAGATAQSATIYVAAPVADAITFVSASPEQIFVAGSGADEQAQVRFRVRSSTGVAMPGVSVRLSIVTNPGGVGINTAGSTDSVEKQTDQNGDVSVSVFSGAIPGPVKLRAALSSNSNTFAETQNLTVASGPATQSRMSLAVETVNIEGADIDGVGTRLTARVADRQGNAVQDGTVVNFTAEGGQVAYSCATVQTNKIASCSVEFVSQNPRPVDGRVSVLAYLAGAKDYDDLNGNNRYDTGDTLSNQGDAYRDNNENDQWDDGEFYIPRGGSATCAGAGDATPAKADTCDTSLATTVRQQVVILLASSDATTTETTFATGPGVITVGNTTQSVVVTTGISFQVASAGQPLLPMPVGTTLAVAVTDQTLNDGLTCKVERAINNSPVPNVRPGNAPGNLATLHNVLLSGCRLGDSVQLTVTAPSGLQTLIPVTLP